jgi:hypothetical protein
MIMSVFPLGRSCGEPEIRHAADTTLRGYGDAGNRIAALTGINICGNVTLRRIASTELQNY